MTVIEVIKEFKLPQKVLAEKLNMNYTTFRKKMNGAGNKFSDEDLRQLSVAVFDYVEELNKNVQKHLQKVDQNKNVLYFYGAVIDNLNP